MVTSRARPSCAIAPARRTAWAPCGLRREDISPALAAAGSDVIAPGFWVSVKAVSLGILTVNTDGTTAVPATAILPTHGSPIGTESSCCGRRYSCPGSVFRQTHFFRDTCCAVPGAAEAAKSERAARPRNSHHYRAKTVSSFWLSHRRPEVRRNPGGPQLRSWRSWRNAVVGNQRVGLPPG